MVQEIMITHRKYASNPSLCIDPVHALAERIGRQEVTAQWVFDHPQGTTYVYDTTAVQYNLDPWRLVDGMDRRTDGSLSYWLAHGVTDRPVTAQTRFFIEV
jgi:hypothetical protein